MFLSSLAAFDRPVSKRTGFSLLLPVRLLAAGAVLWVSGCATGPDPAATEDRNANSVPVVTIAPQTAAAAATKEPAPVAPATPAPVATGSVAPASPLPPLAVAPAPTPAPAAPPAAAPAKATALQHKTGPLVKGFYINVGLFAVASNASTAYQKLESAGLPVFSDVVKKKSGPLTRVRVGPYTTQAQADKAAAKIRTLKLDAAVFRH